MVSVNPVALATPVHTIGASTRVTVNLSGGWPFTRMVIFAPTANGPSILAITMTSPGPLGGVRPYRPYILGARRGVGRPAERAFPLTHVGHLDWRLRYRRCWLRSRRPAGRRLGGSAATSPGS